MYAKDISKKVRSSIIVKKQNGEFVGKLAPYGYIKDPKDKHKFLIDKNVSHIIRKIFDMILDGEIRRQVTEFLNDNDILTPNEYLNIDKNKDVSVMKKWNPDMIKRTSKERVYYYCSNYYRNKTCENNESISENKLIEIINEKLNLSNITRLELENKVKCIYIDKNKSVKIDIK